MQFATLSLTLLAAAAPMVAAAPAPVPAPAPVDLASTLNQVLSAVTGARGEPLPEMPPKVSKYLNKTEPVAAVALEHSNVHAKAGLHARIPVPPTPVSAFASASGNSTASASTSPTPKPTTPPGDASKDGLGGLLSGLTGGLGLGSILRRK